MQANTHNKSSDKSVITWNLSNYTGQVTLKFCINSFNVEVLDDKQLTSVVKEQLKWAIQLIKTDKNIKKDFMDNLKCERYRDTCLTLVTFTTIFTNVNEFTIIYKKIGAYEEYIHTELLIDDENPHLILV